MANHISFSRRVFIKATMGATVIGSAALVAGCGESNVVDRKLQFGSLRAALNEAEELAQASITNSDLFWPFPQTLVHCAQSIEYSMTGFPEMKSPIFQNTAGAAAFNLFAWRGRMSHNLTEEIPGAPSLRNETDVPRAMTRLRKAIDDFELTERPLEPHFAYGNLDKADYELAHAMHLANHFSAIAV